MRDSVRLVSMQFVWCIRYSKWHGTLGLLEGSDSHSVSSPVQIEALWNCAATVRTSFKEASRQPNGPSNVCSAQVAWSHRK